MSGSTNNAQSQQARVAKSDAKETDENPTAADDRATNNQTTPSPPPSLPVPEAPVPSAVKSAKKNEIQKFICLVCSKEFGTKGSLKTHNRVHTGEKPFVCPVPGCGRSFSQHPNCVRHVKLLHAGFDPKVTPPTRRPGGDTSYNKRLRMGLIGDGEVGHHALFESVAPLVKANIGYAPMMTGPFLMQGGQFPMGMTTMYAPSPQGYIGAPGQYAQGTPIVPTMMGPRMSDGHGHVQQQYHGQATSGPRQQGSQQGHQQQAFYASQAQYAQMGMNGAQSQSMMESMPIQYAAYDPNMGQSYIQGQHPIAALHGGLMQQQHLLFPHQYSGHHGEPGPARPPDKSWNNQ